VRESRLQAFYLLRNLIVRKMATKVWLRFRSTNIQASNPKQYPNLNFEFPNGRVSEFGHLVIGNYLDFGI
jgi:hypothetical protein